MRPLLRLLSGGLLLLFSSAPATAATPSGARLHWLSGSRHGEGSVLVEILDDPTRERLGPTPDPHRFRVLAGKGGVEVSRVEQPALLGEPLSVVLAFDASRSFAPFLEASVDLARSFATARAGAVPGPTRVLLFGTDLESLGVAEDDASLSGLLDRVRERAGRHPVTRLRSLLARSVEMTAEPLSVARGGGRLLLVFTDGGEESGAWSTEALVARARDLGVSVHVVLFTPRRGDANLATRMDQMKALAESAGGSLIQGARDPDAHLRVARLAGVMERLYRLDLAWCGVDGSLPFVEDRISLEVLQDGRPVAWTEDLPYSLETTAEAARPCAVNGATTPTPSEPSLPSPGGDAAAADPVPRAACGLLSGLGALLGAFLAFLLLLVALLPRRRSKPPAPAVEPQEPMVPPTPSSLPGPEPPPLSAVPLANPLGAADLPETRLVLLDGPPGLAPVLRIHDARVVLGREAAPGVDIVLPHPRVSAPHALFRLRTDGSLTVTDLGSTNGTFVRGEEIPRDRPVALAHGDRVGIGRDLHYEVSQPATAPEVQAPSPKLPRARPVAQTVYEPLGPGPASKKLEP